MIIDYSRNPINYGKIEDHDVTFHDSNPLCGDSIDIDMKFNENKVSDIKFHGKGCAICMACSSVLTEIVKGKEIDEVRNITSMERKISQNAVVLYHLILQMYIHMMLHKLLMKKV